MSNICDSIKSLKPYQSGKPISELRRELGLEKVVKLASNENPLGIGQKTLAAMTQALSEVNRYPDSNGFELKQAIGKHLNLAADKITLGNGSNDILELVARAYVCSNTHEVIFSEYAFVVYPLVTQALGARAVVVKSKDFGHDLSAMLAAISDKTKLIFIANPNNPTGTFLADNVVHQFLSNVPNSVIVVLDQAYFEYLDAPDVALEWLAEFDNLIISRTFSKAYGLAGLRVGYALSSGKIADYLNRIRQPFNVNHVAQVAATMALDDQSHLLRSVLANKNGRQQLTSGFEKLGLSYIPSAANFVAVKVDNAPELYRQLLALGFIVRPVEMKNYLRVSVGTAKEIEGFLDALATLL
jgi:histidinol-phosphate aminotransferase